MSGMIIETGVDKLVHLVNKKKKVSVSEASKELGISVAVIEEWADFLEEEGIISLEYKLATTYLVERKLGKHEVEKKAKEFVGKKESFIRKVETTMSHIDRETEGLDEIKEHFSKLSKDLSGELGHVKSELKEMENYERLKKEIDKQMLDQEQDFKSKMNEMDKQILEEKRKYQAIVDDINSERVKIEQERNTAFSLEEQERDIKKKLDAFSLSLDSLKNKVKMEDEMIAGSEKHIESFKKLADNIKEEIDSKRDSIKDLVDDQKKHSKKIIDLQKEVMTKVMEKRKTIEEQVSYGERIGERFDHFFRKKADVEKMLNAVEKDKLQLKQEMVGLINKAKAFDLSTKSSDVKSHIKELESKFKELDSKKGKFEKELKKLGSLLSIK